MLNIPSGSSKIVDTFKKYIGEHDIKIIGVDATMITLTILFSYYLILGYLTALRLTHHRNRSNSFTST
jgi:hypothetical protein